MAGAVVQDALLPLLRVDALADCGVDHDQLAGDPPRFLQEAIPLIGEEVAVEVAREHPVELAVAERQRHRVALDDPGAGHPCRGNLDHGRALIEPDDLAAQVLGQIAGAAGDVEHATWRQAAHHLAHLLDLLMPARPVELGVQPAAEPPVVVLAGARVVVRAHALVDDGQ